MARYSKGSQRKVKKLMDEMKSGKLKSGRGGRKVTNRKQAIAIGLSEARKQGSKVPPKKKAAPKKKSVTKKAAPKKRTTARKAAPKKRNAAKKATPKKRVTAKKKSSR